MLRKCALLICFLLISACTPTVFNTYNTTTLSEQPIIPKSLEFDLSSEDFYFYEKFLADKLTPKLKEQGWAIKENNADYRLILRYGINQGLRTIAGIVPVGGVTITMQSRVYVLTERNIVFKLENKKTGKPRIYGIIRASKDFDDMDLMMLLNNSVSIISDEMTAVNAIQRKEWTCRVEIEKEQYKHSKCSAEEVKKYGKYPHELDIIKDMDFFTPIVEKNKAE